MAVMVLRSRLTEVYALLGTEPLSEPMADPAVIQKAVQESSGPMRAVLDLPASRPDQWLNVHEIRDSLEMDVHELPGVLSTFPRRWRKRYHQTAPLPSEQEGKGSERRYMMRQEVAELNTSLTDHHPA